MVVEEMAVEDVRARVVKLMMVSVEGQAHVANSDYHLEDCAVGSVSPRRKTEGLVNPEIMNAVTRHEVELLAVHDEEVLADNKD
jgi:hypothetical protein